MPGSALHTQYWIIREHLKIIVDLILYNVCMVIPQSIREEILTQVTWQSQNVSQVHRDLFGGPISQEISSAKSQWVTHVPKIDQLTVSHLILSPCPDRPWSLAVVDLMECKGHTYVVAVDYLSRWE